MTVMLFLVRHATSDFDSREFLGSPRGSQWDPPLGERGRDQARALTARLALMDPPEAIYVSPFRRCRQTLQPYLDQSGREATVVDDIGEVFVGDWEGMSFEEIISGDEELARRFREQEPMFGLAPGGETGADLRSRVVPAIEGMLDEVRSGSILVVTHGGVINAYLGHILGFDQDMFFLPDNASINTVRAESDRRQVRFLNDVRHITDPAIFAPLAGAS